MASPWRPLVAICAALLAGGCSNFHETHYFASVDKQTKQPINYYRLKVSGNSHLSSSRYLSGYFDETAVDAYFSEFVQPGDGEFPTPQSLKAARSEEAERTEIRSLDGGLENRRLVLLLTSNSDEVAAGIQSIAQSEAVAATLARFVSQSRLAQSQEAASDLETAKSRAKAVGALGASLLVGLPETPAPDDLRQNLLRYANALAAYLGVNQGFASLDEVDQWLRQSSVRMLED